MAGVSQTTVSRYYRAWELAASDHPQWGAQVPKAETLDPNDLQLPEEIATDEDIEALAQPFNFYLEWARTGKVPELVDDSESDEDESPSETKPQLSVVEDETDESDSVDEDFGLPSEESEESEESEDERVEADTELQKDDLLSILESVRALTEKVTATEVLGGNDEILVQIAEAANELASTATALSAKTEAA